MPNLSFSSILRIHGNLLLVKIGIFSIYLFFLIWPDYVNLRRVLLNYQIFEIRNVLALRSN